MEWLTLHLAMLRLTWVLWRAKRGTWRECWMVVDAAAHGHERAMDVLGWMTGQPRKYRLPGEDSHG